eukprot:COSAG02_NODE_1581_length_11839_cov_9.055451_7_plen_176_part_00
MIHVLVLVIVHVHTYVFGVWNTRDARERNAQRKKKKKEKEKKKEEEEEELLKELKRPREERCSYVLCWPALEQRPRVLDGRRCKLRAGGHDQRALLARQVLRIGLLARQLQRVLVLRRSDQLRRRRRGGAACSWVALLHGQYRLRCNRGAPQHRMRLGGRGTAHGAGVCCACTAG